MSFWAGLKGTKKQISIIAACMEHSSFLVNGVISDVESLSLKAGAVYKKAGTCTSECALSSYGKFSAS